MYLGVTVFPFVFLLPQLSLAEGEGEAYDLLEGTSQRCLTRSILDRLWGIKGNLRNEEANEIMNKKAFLNLGCRTRNRNIEEEIERTDRDRR